MTFIAFSQYVPLNPLCNPILLTANKQKIYKRSFVFIYGWEISLNFYNTLIVHIVQIKILTNYTDFFKQWQK